MWNRKRYGLQTFPKPVQQVKLFCNDEKPIHLYKPFLMPTGPVIDSAATLAGAIPGTLFSTKVPEHLKTMLPLTFGVLSMAMGMVMIAKVNLLPPVILAVLIGSTIGELLKIEQGIGRVAMQVNRWMATVLPQKPKSQDNDNFLNSFVAVLVLFSASAPVFSAP